MYWVYGIPNWLFETLTIFLFVAFGLTGLFASRRWMRGMHFQHSYNDLVGFYLAGITVLYGVTLGLFAIGVWTTFTETQAKVAKEAASISSLYRSLGSLPEPLRGQVEQDLRDYTYRVIYVGWPEQKRGILPVENRLLLDKLQKDFELFNPSTDAQRILESNISGQFDILEESRSMRLDSVTDELPPQLWTLILMGAIICIVVTWYFHIESLQMHIWMTIFIAGLLGLMIFIVAALDNPYRGAISVSPEPLVRVYHQMKQPGD